MTIINATPHAITIIAADGSVAAEFPPSGAVVRVAEQATDAGNINGVPLFSVTYGDVEDIPATATEGTVYIVSAMVLAAAPHRTDLVAPYGFVRSDTGAIIGARGFRR